jgi:alpha-tubulin suppressor-like RCC1 family protein
VEISILNGKDIKFISSGFAHTTVSTNEPKVYSFGQNSRGQLGLKLINLI